MIAAELVRSGHLADALEALQKDIRQNPQDQGLRVFLFQLDCVLGRFEKALSQLQLLANLDAETMVLAQVLRQLIGCELLRKEIFAGNRTPMIFGEPTEWMGLLIQAATSLAQGRIEESAQLRAQAFEAAPATPGKIDGKPFEWIADADSRLGPVLEAILDGKYYWVPFCRVASVQFSKPTDLRDVVWLPAHFTWTNGGNAAGFIPVRYPGSEDAGEDALRLARKTAWKEVAPETFLGTGQRMFSTEASDYPLLDCRALELSPPSG